jgi:hypothetical protein
MNLELACPPVERRDQVAIGIRAVTAGAKSPKSAMFALRLLNGLRMANYRTEASDGAPTQR